MERSFLVYKGEDTPMSNMLYERPTHERNGVKLTVALRPYDYQTALRAIREQCSYFNNVYFSINGFDNSYTIFETDLFRFNTLNSFPEMHISLKGVYYPINWKKIGIPAVLLPVALRFDSYDEIRPILNREELQWDGVAIEAIKQKIKEVSEWFIQRWNDENIQEDSLFKSWHKVRNNIKEIILENEVFEIAELEQYSAIKFSPLKIKGINLLKPSQYFEVISATNERYTCSVKRDYRNRFKEDDQWRLDVGSIIERPGSGVIISKDVNISGFFRTYLKERTNYVKFLKERSFSPTLKYYKALLGLKVLPKTDWRAIIQEFQAIEKEFISELLVDGTKLHLSEDFLAYKEENRAKQKNKGGKRLDKQKGQVTMGYGRYNVFANGSEGNNIVFPKQVYDLDKLHKQPYATIVFSQEEREQAIKWYRALNRYDKKTYRVAIVGKAEMNKIKDIKGVRMFVKIKTGEECNKLVQRALTAQLFTGVVEEYNTLNNNNIIGGLLPEVEQQHQELRDYISKHRNDGILSTVEIVNNNVGYDMTLWAEYTSLQQVVSEFDFVKHLYSPSRLDRDGKKELGKFVNEVLLMRKKNNPEMYAHLEITVKQPEHAEAEFSDAV